MSKFVGINRSMVLGRVASHGTFVNWARMASFNRFFNRPLRAIGVRYLPTGLPLWAPSLYRVR